MGICYAQCLVLLQWNSTISLELFLVLIAIMSGRLIFVSNIEYRWNGCSYCGDKMDPAQSHPNSGSYDE